MGDSSAAQASATAARASDDKPSTSDKDDSKKPSSRYSDPIFKQISVSNGLVNRLTKDELKAKLKELHLDTRGVKEVLKKRLKYHYQKHKLNQAKVKLLETREMTDYFVVIDFEATCEENVQGYPHEIIEFPLVLICSKTHTMVDELQEYCKPRINPTLTNFCTQLTGIGQETVDKADYFPEVLARVEAWMEGHKLGTEKTFTITTDGPWDMSRFLHAQCNQCRIPFPKWARRWLNVRKAYRNYYQFQHAKLTTMLESLGMEFEGQQHSGIDDSRNIGRVVMRLLGDGAVLHPNEKIFAQYLKENQKVCIEVHSCSKKEEDGQGDAECDGVGEDEALKELDSVTFSYNGKYEVSIQNTKKKGPKKQAEKLDWAEEVEGDPEDDVSDLMRWMKMK